MSNPQDFYTRSDITTEFKLKTPDGKDSDFHLLVLGIESKLWRKTRRDSLLENLSKSLNDNNIPKSIVVPEMDHDLKTAKLLSKIVKGWNFDQPFSVEAVEELLYNSPHNCDDLDGFISVRENFLKKK